MRILAQAALFASGAVAAIQAMYPPGQAQFRARSDAVVVDVSVVARNQPVRGLTREDFVLSDNGVPQSIQLLSVESVPIEITLLLHGHHFEDSKALAAALDRVTALLAPDDRLQLLEVSNVVRQIAPWQTPTDSIATRSLVRHGHFWTQDALALTLMRGGTGRRRHLVVFLTPGARAGATIRPDSLVQIAGRFDGVLHVIVSTTAGEEILRPPAELTGGELHRGGSPRRVAEALERIVGRFRQSYVLRYAPEQVAPGGWHTIDVKVVRPDRNRYTVRARTGYWWDER